MKRLKKPKANNIIFFTGALTVFLAACGYDIKVPDKTLEPIECTFINDDGTVERIEYAQSEKGLIQEVINDGIKIGCSNLEIRLPENASLFMDKGTNVTDMEIKIIGEGEKGANLEIGYVPETDYDTLFYTLPTDEKTTSSITLKNITFTFPSKEIQDKNTYENSKPHFLSSEGAGLDVTLDKVSANDISVRGCSCVKVKGLNTLCISLWECGESIVIDSNIDSIYAHYLDGLNIESVTNYNFSGSNISNIIVNGLSSNHFELSSSDDARIEGLFMPGGTAKIDYTKPFDLSYSNVRDLRLKEIIDAKVRKSIIGKFSLEDVIEGDESSVTFTDCLFKGPDPISTVSGSTKSIFSDCINGSGYYPRVFDKKTKKIMEIPVKGGYIVSSNGKLTKSGLLSSTQIKQAQKSQGYRNKGLSSREKAALWDTDHERGRGR